MPSTLHPEGGWTVPRGPVAYRLVHELEGLLEGFRADGVIHSLEVERLRAWLAANAAYARVQPFKEMADRVEHALSDGVFTLDEVEDLLFVCGKLTTVNPHFDALRSGVQTLMGLISGITADHRVTEQELEAMQAWLESTEHLIGMWPYDECAAIVTAAQAGVLLPPHVEALRDLSRQFPIGGAEVAGEPVPVTVRGICAVDPQLEFPGRTFVFTGESKKASRGHLADIVIRAGGKAEDNVTRRTDFLVVCAEGSNFWAFSCYGRKVEKAYNQRRSGHHVMLVHEVDFWDALVV